MEKYKMDLRLFDDGAAGAGGTTGMGTAGAGDAGAGQGGTEGGRDFSSEFDAMIKGEYKEAYAKKVEQIVKERLKGSKQAEARLKDAESLLALVGERYGQDGKDLAALWKTTGNTWNRKHLKKE